MVAKNQKGQAIFELIIFMPLFLFLIKTLFDYGDAINHSINQNKAVRGYYFYVAANDSYLPNIAFMDDFSAINSISLDTFSWSTIRVPDENPKPRGSCVKVPGFLGNGINEECNDPAPDDNKTQFIRVYTSFGVCTGSFLQTNAGEFNLSWENAAAALCQRFSN
tara:strand:+ start:2764 stop:3255 length:492 start_codon:yes stop_codon:yes gene_type:complete